MSTLKDLRLAYDFANAPKAVKDAGDLARTDQIRFETAKLQISLWQKEVEAARSDMATSAKNFNKEVDKWIKEENKVKKEIEV